MVTLKVQLLSSRNKNTHMVQNCLFFCKLIHSFVIVNIAKGKYSLCTYVSTGTFHSEVDCRKGTLASKEEDLRLPVDQEVSLSLGEN